MTEQRNAPKDLQADAYREAYSEAYPGVYEEKRENTRLALPQLLAAHRRKRIATLLADLYAEDQAELLSELAPEQRRTALRALGDGLLPDTLTHFEPSLLSDVVALLPKVRLASMLSALQTDDLVELFETLPSETSHRLLDLLLPRTRLLIRQGLRYAEDSAGRLMRREIATVPEHWSVGQIIDYFRSAKARGTQMRESFYAVILVSPELRPVGTVPVSRLLASKRTVLAMDIAEHEMHLIEVGMHTDKVAHLFHKYGLVELPVIDERGRLCGSVTVDDVVEVIEERNEEDILNLAGVSAHDFYADLLQILRARLPWLALNLLTAFLASRVVAGFAQAIEQLVALAVLMPIVASMGGNAGTQTLAVTVRSLALQRISGRNVRRLVGKECLLNLINGMLFAVLTSLVAWWWFDDVVLSVVILVAMGANILLAGIVGVCTPLLLQRLEQDPAVGSSIILTTCTDIFGFFSFLGLAAWILL